MINFLISQFRCTMAANDLTMKGARASVAMVLMQLALNNSGWHVNTLRPGQNGRRFADDTFKRIFLNENVRISIKISLKFVPKGPINNNPSLVQIMAWRRSGDKPLSEPMMVSLLTHICVTRPQWVKGKNIHGCHELGTFFLSHHATHSGFCVRSWHELTLIPAR